MRDLHDTQPGRSIYLQRRDEGLRAPPRLLFWGVILFFILVIGGLAGVILGFREVLRPAQQQRVINQLPFMRVLLNPTPIGGVFPTIVSPANADDALSLLDMPLELPAPTESETRASAIATDLPATATPLSVVDDESSPTPPATALPPTALPPSPLPTPVEAAASATTALPTTARIYGIRHQQQTWNNCGPATITMALSYYGWQRDQAFAGSALKPNREDKNVSPHELAAFVEAESNVKAIVRMGGTLDLLKLLVANEFPVVIETGAMFEAYDWIGHYRALVSYDDTYQVFYFFDSFLGVGDVAQGVTETYANVDRDWQAFNRTFIVVYEPQREGILRALMDSHWNEQDAAQLAYERARQEARRQPQNGFAWFNIGSSLAALERYQEAAVAFDQANRTGKLPWRMHWYQFGAFEAYYRVGRFDDVLSLVNVNQNSSRELEETYFWQGRVYESQGKRQQAAASFRRALAYNPNYDEARQALENLN